VSSSDISDILKSPIENFCYGAVHKVRHAPGARRDGG